MNESENMPALFGWIFAAMIPLSLFAAFHCRKHADDLKNPLGDTVRLDLPIYLSLSVLLITFLTPFIPGFGALAPVIIVLAIIGAMASQNINIKKLWYGHVENGLFYLRWTIMVYLAIFLPLFLVALFSQGILQLLGVEIKPQNTINMFMEIEGLEQQLTFFVLACILAPITEEIFFRGFLYPLLKTKFNKRVAIGVSSVFFGVIHFHVPSALPLTLLGVVLCIVYEHSGRLTLAIAIHAFFNFVTLLILIVCLSLGIEPQFG